MRKTAIFFMIVSLFYGCKKNDATATSGSTLMLVADPYQPLLQQEVDQFTSLYPAAHLVVRQTSTRDAIVQMLNDSVHTLCIDRELNEEENNVIEQASMHVVKNRIADDAYAVIVHRLNPITQVSKSSLAALLGGTASHWQQIPESHWSGSIEFVVTNKNSGEYENLRYRIFTIKKDLQPAAVVGSQQEVVQYVAKHPQAIGFVASMLQPSFPENIKVLSVEADSNEAGYRFLRPTQENIYQRLYPLRYSLYLYAAEQKTALGGGFSAFALTISGQKIIQNAGIVPAIIPSRRIQLKAE